MKFTYLIGALIIALMMVAPVAAVNEYRDMNPANDVVDPSTYGYAQFFIRAGGSAQDLNIYVQNAQQNLSFDPRWNPDRTDIPEQNGNWMLVEVLPDGASEKVLLASGRDYQACLRNGNGNQVECQNFIVGGADITRVAFLGAAVSCEEPVNEVCLRDVLSATYGACVKELVEDAWTEYKGDYKKVGDHYEYVGHNMADYDVTFHKDGWWGYYKKVDGHYVYSQYGGLTSQEWRDVKHVSYTEPEYHPAQYKTDCESGYDDVTDEVREVVSLGHLSFLFDNRPSPGGIFDVDGTTLLYGIADPAPGVKKTVTITYKDCSGVEHTITEDEYDIITLT